MTITYIFHFNFLVIDPCLETFVKNGSSVLRDSGVCGAHGTCVSLSGGKHRCKCDKDYTGNHCHLSKYTLCSFVHVKLFTSCISVGYIMYIMKVNTEEGFF